METDKEQQKMSQVSELERMFKDEVRQKKRIANNVHHKTGKRGYVGKMLFPSDFMSRSEKMRYRRSSKMTVTNLYSKIIPVEEFEKLSKDDKFFMMKYWRDNYPNKQIMREMGVYNKQYYDIVKDLGLPKAPRIYGNASSVAIEANKETTYQTNAFEFEEAAEETKEIEKVEEPEKAAEVQEIIVDGLHLVYNGTFEAEKIRKQLMKFSALLEEDESEFYCEIKLVQKVKSFKED